MAPAAGQMPQTRGDLEGLSRLAIEQIGAALGVPADLLFNGRFASKSTSQLSLVRFRFLAHSFTPRQSFNLRVKSNCTSSSVSYSSTSSPSATW